MRLVFLLSILNATQQASLRQGYNMCKFRKRFRHIITFRDFHENCLITFLTSILNEDFIGSEVIHRLVSSQIRGIRCDWCQTVLIFSFIIFRVPLYLILPHLSAIFIINTISYRLKIQHSRNYLFAVKLFHNYLFLLILNRQTFSCNLLFGRNNWVFNVNLGFHILYNLTNLLFLKK